MAGLPFQSTPTNEAEVAQNFAKPSPISTPNTSTALGGTAPIRVGGGGGNYQAPQSTPNTSTALGGTAPIRTAEQSLSSVPQSTIQSDFSILRGTQSTQAGINPSDVAAIRGLNSLGYNHPNISPNQYQNPLSSTMFGSVLVDYNIPKNFPAPKPINYDQIGGTSNLVRLPDNYGLSDVWTGLGKVLPYDKVFNTLGLNVSTQSVKNFAGNESEYIKNNEIPFQEAGLKNIFNNLGQDINYIVLKGITYLPSSVGQSAAVGAGISGGYYGGLAISRAASSVYAALPSAAQGGIDLGLTGLEGYTSYTGIKAAVTPKNAYAPLDLAVGITSGISLTIKGINTLTSLKNIYQAGGLSGYKSIKTLTPEEVLSGNKKFLESSAYGGSNIAGKGKQAFDLNVFNKQGYGYHAAPTPFKSNIVQTSESELPGLYIAPGVSPHFLGLDTSGGKGSGSLGFFPKINRAGIYQISPGEFEIGYKPSGKPGTAFVTGMKPEIEAVISPGTELTSSTGSRGFTIYNRRVVPINSFDAVTGNIVKSVNRNLIKASSLPYSNLPSSRGSYSGVAGFYKDIFGSNSLSSSSGIKNILKSSGKSYQNNSSGSLPLPKYSYKNSSPSSKTFFPASSSAIEKSLSSSSAIINSNISSSSSSSLAFSVASGRSKKSGSLKFNFNLEQKKQPELSSRKNQEVLVYAPDFASKILDLKFKNPTNKQLRNIAASPIAGLQLRRLI